MNLRKLVLFEKADMYSHVLTCDVSSVQQILDKMLTVILRCPTVAHHGAPIRKENSCIKMESSYAGTTFCSAGCIPCVNK